MSLKSLMVFVAIVAFIGVNSLFQIDCPVCNGTGYIRTHVEDLRITDVSPVVEIISDYEEGFPIGLESMVSSRLNVEPPDHGIRVSSPGTERQGLLACGVPYLRYYFSFNVSLSNEGPSKISGALQLVVVDPKGKVVRDQPLLLEVPANTQQTISTRLFVDSESYANYFDVFVRVPSDPYVPCSICEGKGKISLIKWSFIQLGIIAL